MEALSKNYQKSLEAIAKEIQDSDILAQYLDDEEEESYRELIAQHEPSIEALHEQVALENPLQLISFEKALLDPAYEGLFLPRILGYSVLRGVVTEDYHYYRPQEHLGDVLLAIARSMNFEMIRLRIGQAVQLGFALSSDIWITNLLNEIDNKKVKAYFSAQTLSKFRDLKERQIAYARFEKQFSHMNFQTAEFPREAHDLRAVYPGLKKFIQYRVLSGMDHSSYLDALVAVVDDKKFAGEPEYLEFALHLALFFEMSTKQRAVVAGTLNGLRKNAGFADTYFERLERLYRDRLPIGSVEDERMRQILDLKIKDDITAYYETVHILHSKGYLHEDTIQAFSSFYNQHEGLSRINECLRHAVMQYFAGFMKNLPESDYTEYFEINKTFVQYMNIFSNEKFNQDLKDISMAYIRRLLKVYTDKRGKDYQDIKRFVSGQFVELGFLKEKEVIELFKTRRRKSS